jgi:hypothetical protein
MKNRLRITVGVLMASLLAILAVPMQAQAVTSNVASVTLNANVNTTLTVSATPASISFSGSGTNPAPVQGSSPISVTTTWNLSSTATLTVYEYFASTTALTNSGPTIPSSAVTASVNGGTATPFTGTCAAISITGSCGPNVASVAITSANLNNTHTDSVVLAINLNGAPAGAYTGTWNVQAVAV